MIGKITIFFVGLALVSGFPYSEHEIQDFELDHDEGYEPEIYESARVRRSLQPGAPNFPNSQNNQKNGGWAVSPNVGRDENGNTRADIGVQHKGPNHDFDAGWGKVIRGQKAKPTWHVGGTYRW